MSEYKPANINHYRFVDLTGKRFGRLTVEHLLGKRGAFIYWACRCDCGGYTETQTGKLNIGHSQSCGCILADKNATRLTTHGASVGGKPTPTYSVWRGIKNRCLNPNEPAYKNYGGRGIKICDRWKDSFENFFTDMGQKPKGMWIERLDNEGDYEPTNCKWATPKEQCNNKRTNVYLTFRGKTQTVSQWNEELGYNKNVVAGRLRLGWSTEDAILTPARKLPRR